MFLKNYELKKELRSIFSYPRIEAWGLRWKLELLFISNEFVLGWVLNWFPKFWVEGRLDPRTLVAIEMAAWFMVGVAEGLANILGKTVTLFVSAGAKIPFDWVLLFGKGELLVGKWAGCTFWEPNWFKLPKGVVLVLRVIGEKDVVGFWEEKELLFKKLVCGWLLFRENWPLLDEFKDNGWLLIAKLPFAFTGVEMMGFALLALVAKLNPELMGVVDWSPIFCFWGEAKFPNPNELVGGTPNAEPLEWPNCAEVWVLWRMWLILSYFRHMLTWPSANVMDFTKCLPSILGFFDRSGTNFWAGVYEWKLFTCSLLGLPTKLLLTPGKLFVCNLSGPNAKPLGPGLVANEVGAKLDWLMLLFRNPVVFGRPELLKGCWG